MACGWADERGSIRTNPRDPPTPHSIFVYCSLPSGVFENRFQLILELLQIIANAVEIDAPTDGMFGEIGNADGLL